MNFTQLCMTVSKLVRLSSVGIQYIIIDLLAKHTHTLALGYYVFRWASLFQIFIIFFLLSSRLLAVQETIHKKNPYSSN